MVRHVALLLVLAALGCEQARRVPSGNGTRASEPKPDASAHQIHADADTADVGTTDAAGEDAAAPAEDAGFPLDASPEDAFGFDAIPAADAAPDDASGSDASWIDAGFALDARALDAGAPDAQVLDSGVADAGSGVLPAGSICSLAPLAGNVILLEESGGNLGAPPNDYAYTVFRGLWYLDDPTQPVTYLIALVPDFPRVRLGESISANADFGQRPVPYWTAVDGVPMIAVPAARPGSQYTVRRDLQLGSGPFKGWVYAYVGTHAGDRPPEIHPSDRTTVCNLGCGRASPNVSPIGMTVASMRFDVPGDDESVDVSMPQAHHWSVGVACPSGQAPSVSLSIGSMPVSDLLEPAVGVRMFAGRGGSATINLVDRSMDPTPYTCSVSTADYGMDEPDLVLSTESTHLASVCTSTRAFGFSGDQELVRILQPRGHGYYAVFTPLDGATLSVEPHSSDGSRDDFRFTTSTSVRVAHNPSYPFNRLRMTSNRPGTRASIRIERGPIDEDENTSSIYLVPPIALNSTVTAALFGVDNDRFRPSAVAGHLYSIVARPLDPTYDIQLNIEDPDSRVSAPAVVRTGGAGATESRRILASGNGSFVVVVEDPRGLVTLARPMLYTVRVDDLGPE